ncbi:dynamin family protein [Salirhabdus salicampi]|uniref:dynamin family protein n=1 Tax=Salirhabdus salicampi TaxID=476102 RepID=UPI0020C56006|nr:dynamin family protein [Salirhabdus salicampi]MCP8616119.1 dynamin family protein [Salirhabdus salicampi]
MKPDIKESQSTELTLQRLLSLYRLLQEEGSEQLPKVADLIEKALNKELVLGFAGHFSAGKSTMINDALGQQILPSSPIPTSANLVKVKTSPKEYARIFYRYEDPVQYKAPYDIEAIQQMCRDGDAIEAIEISKHDLSIPEHVTLLDTPGIDSSNDADRVITESGLHIVDVLFYVMDYNHVQSEVNLAFLKEMGEKNKPFYVVINQIDKHEEKELSFQSFQQSVQDTFQKWKIKPEQIFYTTLKDKNHRHNQFSNVKKVIHQVMLEQSKLIKDTVHHSAKAIVEEHVNSISKDYDEERTTLEEKIEQLETELSSFNNEPEHEGVVVNAKEAEKRFKHDLRDLFKNAYLMPYENREKAREYLVSAQSNFKTGILFAKKKTEAERSRRLFEFHSSLMETAKTQVEAHIRELLTKYMRYYDVQHDDLFRKIQGLSVSYEMDRLRDLVKSGAEVTGDYVLVYCEDVANDLKQMYRQEATKIWDSIFLSIQHHVKRLSQQQKHEEQKQHELAHMQKARKQIDDKVQSIKEHLLSTLSSDHPQVDEQKSNEIIQAIRKKRENIRTEVLPVNRDLENEREYEVQIDTKTTSFHDVKVSAEEVMKKLDQAANILQPLTGFQNVAADFINRKDRLQNRHYTIALFGAFSAGKTSFANALLGEALLPVSPNPTTATVNKISPPNDKHRHGTALVQLKSEQELIENIKDVTLSDISFHSLQECVDWLKKKNEGKADTVHQSFIEALIQGYASMRELIGKRTVIRRDELADYIVKEDIACYVEWIELFYDCPFTRKGITLVDTPGADSINARHTDVAFDYIKNADAILFVTYYNHAFSQADREFLLQLGRVKDIFALDKMFFILNAADLAKDEDELRAVETYLQSHLLQYGIQQPKTYPLSSKLALEEKASNQSMNSRIKRFEQDFNSFLDEDLTQLFIQSALRDMKNVTEVLDDYIQFASVDQQEKDKQIQGHKTREKSLHDMIWEMPTDPYVKSSLHEIDELVFYIRQRTFLRFSDMYKETFHPGQIKSNGRKGKLELQEALQSLIYKLNLHLYHELQATSLRIENHLSKVMEQFADDLVRKCSEITSFHAFPSISEETYETPEIPHNLVKDSDGQLTKPLSLFKNTKSFFEQNEKEIMKDELQKLLDPIIQEVLEEQAGILQQYYLPMWREKVKGIKVKYTEAIAEYYKGLEYTLTDETYLTALKRSRKQIHAVLSGTEGK